MSTLPSPSHDKEQLSLQEGINARLVQSGERELNAQDNGNPMNNLINNRT